MVVCNFREVNDIYIGRGKIKKKVKKRKTLGGGLSSASDPRRGLPRGAPRLPGAVFPPSPQGPRCLRGDRN